MHHYTLAWHDNQDVEHHICEYAEDSWHAAQYAREDVPYVKEHPYSLYGYSERTNEKLTTHIYVCNIRGSRGSTLVISIRLG